MAYSFHDGFIYVVVNCGKMNKSWCIHHPSLFRGPFLCRNEHGLVIQPWFLFVYAFVLL